MKVKFIIPCYCIEHRPSAADRVDYGMPNLAVAPSQKFWSAFCPECGRGNFALNQESSYKALKDWNQTQKSVWETALYRIDGTPIDTENWKFQYWQEIKAKIEDEKDD